MLRRRSGAQRCRAFAARPIEMSLRSPNRVHERQSFFKYVPASTAAIILRNRTLRWSSPVLFNDPFDVPREISFGLTPADIVEALGVRMAELIRDPPEDTSKLEPKVKLIIDAVKGGISDEVKKELIDGVKDVAATHRPAGESMEVLRTMWRSWIPEMRILSLTESPDHFAMWHHYADAYRGAVIELRCVDELDSAWLAAKPVTYPKEKPGIYTAAGWARLLTLRRDIATRDMLDVATFTKSPDWSYENEWRLLSFKRPTDTSDFSDYRLHLPEVAAVYLGPLMKADDADTIKALMSQYPHARVYRTSVVMTRELQFAPVSA